MNRLCIIPRCRRHVRRPDFAVCETCFARLSRSEPMKPNGRGA